MIRRDGDNLYYGKIMLGELADDGYACDGRIAALPVMLKNLEPPTFFLQPLGAAVLMFAINEGDNHYCVDVRIKYSLIDIVGVYDPSLNTIVDKAIS